MIRRAGLRRIAAISLVLLIAVAIFNYIVLRLERKFAVFVDFSQNRIYSVSEATKELCRGLTDEVVIYYYDSPGNRYANSDYIAGNNAGDMGTKALLESYNAKCENISVITLLGESGENFTSKFGEGIEGGSIIVTNRDASRYRVLTSAELYTDKAYLAESKISGAITYVDTGFVKELRFLTGHREKSILNLSRFVNIISSKNLRYSGYDALSDEELVPGRDVLIIVSPDTDMEEEEYKRVRDFLGRGGNAVFFIDKDGLPYFSKLMREYDLALMPGYIYGTDARYTNMDRSSVIVKPANGGAKDEVVLTNAKPIAVRGRDGESESLLSTYPGVAVNVIERDSYEAAGMDAESFPVCVKSEKNGGKLILFGTSSIVSDEEIDMAQNSSFISSILTEFTSERADFPLGDSHMQKDTGKSDHSRQISYTAQVLMEFFTIFLIPLAAVVFGWIVRRK